jgi:hypothetical protein
MKFMDGTPVDADYAQSISKLVSGAAKTSEMFSEDELENFAAAQAALNQTQVVTQLSA